MIAERVWARISALRAGTRLSLLIVGLLIIVATALVWFGTIRHGILMGDDLSVVDLFQRGQFLTSFFDELTSTAIEKYRPVLNLALGAELRAFGTHFEGYRALNVAIEIACAALISLIVLRIARGNALLALTCALAFIVSRFAYYNVMQVLGILEGLSLLLMLLVVRDVADAFVLGRYERLYTTVLWYALAVFTDERYVVMGLFIVVCVLVHPQSRSKPRAAAIVAGGAVGVLMLFVATRVLLHNHLLVGTGGQVVKFDPLQWNAFFWSAVANLLGFNVGPDYLSAKDVTGAGATGYLLGFAVAVPAMGVFALWAIAAFRLRRAGDLKYAVIGLSLIVPLLLSASVTFRQEFRWLYAADALFLIGIAAVAAQVEPRRVAVGAAVFAFAASIGGAVWYRSFLDNVYLIGAMDVADGVRDAVQHDPNAAVYVIDNGDHNYPTWVFGEQRFFAVYGITRPQVTFVDSAAEVHDAKADILAIKGATVVPFERPPAPVLPFAKPVYSFTDSFDKGTINSNAPVSSPTRRGALLLTWPGPNGAVPSLTLIHPFRYSYALPRVGRATSLAFYVTRPYPVGSPTRALVTVTDGRKSTVVFEELELPASPTKIVWNRRSVDLSRFANHSIVVTFGALASGEPTAAWIAFGYPSLVVGKR